MWVKLCYCTGKRMIYLIFRLTNISSWISFFARYFSSFSFTFICEKDWRIYMLEYKNAIDCKNITVDSNLVIFETILCKLEIQNILFKMTILTNSSFWISIKLTWFSWSILCKMEMAIIYNKIGWKWNTFYHTCILIS